MYLVVYLMAFTAKQQVRRLKMQDLTMTGQIAGVDNDGPRSRGGQKQECFTVVKQECMISRMICQ